MNNDFEQLIEQLRKEYYNLKADNKELQEEIDSLNKKLRYAGKRLEELKNNSK